MRLSLIAICLALIQCPHPGIADSHTLPDSWLIEKVDKSQPIKPGTSVIVSNLYGDVRIRGIKDSEDNQLPMTAIVQRHRDDEDVPEIRYTRGDPTVISVVYPSGQEPSAAPQSTNRPTRRVDIAVYVPHKSDVHAVTESGLIKIKGLKTNVKARSKHGRIWISSSASIDARSTHGDVGVVVKQAGWKGHATLMTRTGSAAIRLPHAINAIADMRTGGMISTDYSVKIRRSRTSHTKYARARIYHGLRRILRVFPITTNRIRMQSQIGDVMLIRPNPELSDS